MIDLLRFLRNPTGVDGSRPEVLPDTRGRHRVSRSTTAYFTPVVVEGTLSELTDKRGSCRGTPYPSRASWREEVSTLLTPPSSYDLATPVSVRDRRLSTETVKESVYWKRLKEKGFRSCVFGGSVLQTLRFCPFRVRPCRVTDRVSLTRHSSRRQ